MVSLSFIKNLCLGGGLGLASGYSYHKYSQLSSLGFGVGFLATRVANKTIEKYLDLNHDGKVDLDDLELLEDEVEKKMYVKLTLTAYLSFVGGFGVGYLVGNVY